MRGEDSTTPSVQRDSSSAAAYSAPAFSPVSETSVRKSAASAAAVTPFSTSAKYGLLRSGTTIPIVCVAPRSRPCAAGLGRYPSRSTAARTRRSRSAETALAPDSTRDTVAGDTAASRATSLIVARPAAPRALAPHGRIEPHGPSRRPGARTADYPGRHIHGTP